MCNEIARRVELGLIREDFSQLRIPLRFPEGMPNLAPLDSIRITDPTAIVRSTIDAPGEAELIQRRWSWPGPTGRPVYNYRSEGRSFANGRCLVPADAFYEFTSSSSPEEEGLKRQKKTKWRFAKRGESWFCIAGLWRAAGQVEEAFTMLTTAPGPDVAPYHDRQIVILERRDWARWLDPAVPATELLHPSPAGSFAVTAVI